MKEHSKNRIMKYFLASSFGILCMSGSAALAEMPPGAGGNGGSALPTGGTRPSANVPPSGARPSAAPSQNNGGNAPGTVTRPITNPGSRYGTPGGRPSVNNSRPGAPGSRPNMSPPHNPVRPSGQVVHPAPYPVAPVPPGRVVRPVAPPPARPHIVVHPGPRGHHYVPAPTIFYVRPATTVVYSTPAVVSDSGCSDGTREGFFDVRMNPNIAACAGGWSVPGVHHDEGPVCGRVSGDSSSNPSGLGCNVEDLCAAGWHVCHGVEDIRRNSRTGCDNILDGVTYPAFFVSREMSNGSLTCSGDGYSNRPAYTNDLFGCGNLGCGLGPERHCGGILTRSGHDGCLALSSSYGCSCYDDGDRIKCSGGLGCNWCSTVSYYNYRDNTSYPDAWECGGDGSREALKVVKSSPDLGGVLCCRN